MIWNLKTIEAISSARAVYLVSEEQLANVFDPQMLMKQVAANLQDQLQKIAETWAVDLQEDDMLLTRDDDQEQKLVRFQMQWNPVNRPGELIGGPYSGTIVQSPMTYGELIPAKIKLQRTADDYSMELAATPDGKHTSVPITTITYEVTGWSDLHRQWIYEPKQ